jgi:hypothetical protein
LAAFRLSALDLITGPFHRAFKARAARGLFGRESNFEGACEQDLAEGRFLGRYFGARIREKLKF